MSAKTPEKIAIATRSPVSSVGARLATRLLFRKPRTPSDGQQREGGPMVKHVRLMGIGAVLMVVAATASTGAWVGSPEQTTYLTFNQRVALPGVELAPGTYIFEVANPNPLTSAAVVRVSSRDRSKHFLMAYTRTIDRPAGLPADRLVSFGEAPRGEAPPIRAWFPEGANEGHEFIYSK
jgi:hypothetical protein